jgi:hypothetical protein
MAKRFFYVCGGILMLALANHFGATNAGAQAGATPVGLTAAGSDAIIYAMTPNGDLHRRRVSVDAQFYALEYVGNFWSGSPTPVQPTSFGALKVKYR